MPVADVAPVVEKAPVAAEETHQVAEAPVVVEETHQVDPNRPLRRKKS